MRSAIGKKYLLNPFDLTEDDSESKHQIGVFVWSEVCYKHGLSTANSPLAYDNITTDNLVMSCDQRFKVLKYLYSYPIGGIRHPATAMKIKHEGAKAGVEDIALDVSRHSWHGLRIEMKAKDGKQSFEQKEWQKFHLEQGYYSVVCYSFIEARDQIVKYLQ